MPLEKTRGLMPPTKKVRSATANEPTLAPKPTGPAHKRSTNKRITTNLVALSSVAILSVYGIGYARTQSSADAPVSQGGSAAIPPDQSAAMPPTAVPPIPSQLPTPRVPTALPTTAPTIGSAAVSGAMPTKTAVPAPATATAAPGAAPTAKPNVRTLRDGSYVGDGFSRHGDIEATVVVSGGKVVSAIVTGCGTRYSCRLVSPLVSEVVSRQTAPIDLVSGATDSSHAYHDAVVKALSQAT